VFARRLSRLWSRLLGVPADHAAVSGVASGSALWIDDGGRAIARDSHRARVPPTDAPPTEAAPDPMVPVDPDAGASFLLSVDDAGQFLVALGRRLVLGHLRGGVADLPFLADVGSSHALLERRDSFRDGTVWSIEPLGGERVRVDGVDVDRPWTLVSGSLVDLSDNLSFRYVVPDPASQSALLELERGAECCGARTIVLFAEGDGGRVRIGAADQRHIRVARVQHEITLVRRRDRLYVACEAAIQGATAGEEGFSLPCPPPQRFDLSVGRSEGGRPPFGLAVEPAESSRER